MSSVRQEPATTVKRIVGSDGIRAIACLWVFVNHVAFFHATEIEEAYPVLWRFLRFGDYGVGMFFVLSGFLLSLPFLKAHRAQAGMPDLKVYAIRRFARIAPAYWLCAIILGVIYGLYQTKWGLFQIGTLLTFTNSFFRSTYLPYFNIPLWSISVEMIFYAMLPVFAMGMLWMKSRWGVRVYTIAVMALITLAQWVLLRYGADIERWVGDTTLFAADGGSCKNNAVKLFAHFLIGVLAADVFLVLSEKYGSGQSGGRSSSVICDMASTVALLIVFAAALCGSALLPQVGYMSYHWPTFSLLIAIMLATLPFSHVVGPLLDNAFFRWVARLSYGIYLWHVPVMAGQAKLWPVDLGSHLLHTALFGAIAFILTCIVAALSYYLVELPVLRYAADRTRTR